MERKLDYVWVIAYINRDHVNTVEMDLVKHGFSSIKVYIPTVRMLKKRFKNRDFYEYVPLLFNYGFFQLPFDKACDPSFLRALKEKIPVIYSWVKDPVKVLRTKPNLRTDNKGSSTEPLEEPEELIDGMKVLHHDDRFTDIAMATEEEISNLLNLSKTMSLFSDDIVEKIEIGQFITLKGYPYEGMPAEIININKHKKQIKVRLLLECIITEVTVNYENIFYTVYSDFDKDTRESSLDEMAENQGNRVNKIFAKINYGDED